MMLSSASRCVLKCLKPTEYRGWEMVCVTAGFGDNATTCAELCRDLSFFFFKKKR